MLNERVYFYETGMKAIGHKKLYGTAIEVAAGNGSTCGGGLAGPTFIIRVEGGGYETRPICSVFQDDRPVDYTANGVCKPLDSSGYYHTDTQEEAGFAS
jgi:hypothetical protein